MSMEQSEKVPEEFDGQLGRQLSLVAPLPVLRPPGLLQRAMDKLLPERSKFFGFTWLLAIAAVFALFGNIQGAATRFHGIAESQQQSISFQYPVEIVEVAVVGGEQVEAGARLLQVRRYDLDVDLAAVEEKIIEVEARLGALEAGSAAEIASQVAQREAELENINTDIAGLETRYQLNLSLAGSISSAGEKEASLSSSPLLARRDGLIAEKNRIAELYQARIGALQQQLRQGLATQRARVAELQQERAELRRQTAELGVRAPFAGSVGSILFKPGEQVDAFSPLISVHASSTQTIKGFIHEAVVNRVAIGQLVWIETMDGGGESRLISGVVESLGSRIVEYPERLKRSAFVSAWGREVVVSLQPDNGLLLGEKVTLLLQRPRPLLQTLLAYLRPLLPISQLRAWVSDQAQQLPQTIDVKIDGLKSSELEASAITWNPLRQSYLLLSDEQAALFEFSPGGEIIGSFSLQGHGKIDDLESISGDGETIYIAASLSHNRKQQLKSPRRNFMRLRMQQQGIVSAESIDLYAILDELRNNLQIDVELRRFIATALAQNNLDLEAHAVVDNRLYLGFKAPQDEHGNTLFILLDDVDALFAGKTATASIWMRLRLAQNGHQPAARLSDFFFDGSKLYLLTVDQAGDGSALWRYHLVGGQLQLLRRFAGLRAEGLSVDVDRRSALVVFDGGGKQASQFLRLEL